MCIFMVCSVNIEHGFLERREQAKSILGNHLTLPC
jgi:hypothetical protein